MNRLWPVVTGALIGILALSNAYWFFAMLDNATVNKALDQQYHETCGALEQALQMMPALAASRRKADVVDAAARTSTLAPFEKDGATWIGWLGFQFGPDGALVRVSPGWEPFTCPP